jgi:hypothetical protein
MGSGGPAGTVDQVEMARSGSERGVRRARVLTSIMCVEVAAVNERRNDEDV